MTDALSPVVSSLLERAAVDNGFDRKLPRVGERLVYASTQCPLCVWLGVAESGDLLVASSRMHRGTSPAATIKRLQSAYDVLADDAGAADVEPLMGMQIEALLDG